MSSRFVLLGTDASAGEGGELRTVEGSRITDKQTLLCELASALGLPGLLRSQLGRVRRVPEGRSGLQQTRRADLKTQGLEVRTRTTAG